MAFDQNSRGPLVHPQRRTTKVNFAVIIAVIVFLVISAVAVFWFERNPERAVPKAEKQQAP